MLARKCDVCSTFYDYYRGKSTNAEDANTIRFIDKTPNNGYDDREVYDLCPACMNRLIETLKTLKTLGGHSTEEPLPSIEWMREYIKEYCQEHKCKNCAIYKRVLHRSHHCYSKLITSDEEILANYLAIKREEENK